MNTLILSGGGAKGCFEAGALYTLFNQIKFDKVYGTSVGALNALMLAQAYLNKSPDIISNVWLKEIQKQSDVYNVNIFRTLLGCTFPLDFKPLRKIMKKVFDFKRIIQDGIPITFNSVDLVSGQTVRISNKDKGMTTDKLFEAAIASASIPPAFKPVKINDYQLVDGGIRDNVPISDILKDENHAIYVILCNPKNFDIAQKDYNGIFDVGTRAIEIMTNEITQNDISNIITINKFLEKMDQKELEKHSDLYGKKIINIKVIEPPQDVCETLDFKKDILLNGFQMGIESSKGLLN